MANDVAKIIWNMAKNDKSFEGLTLKETYNKKKQIESNEIRKKLFDIISDHIKKNPTTSNTLMLSNCGLRGINPIFEKKRVGEVNDVRTNEMKCFDKKDNSVFFEVTNEESKNLIKEGFIPLDLKWNIDTMYNTFTVSWGHWYTQ